MGHEAASATAPDLTAFLARHMPVMRSEAVWLGGSMRLCLDGYLGSEGPPSAYVSSVRSVVFRGDDVLTMRNAGGWHVLPGGRCEPGETPEETLRREVLEEAGLRIERPVRLGFMHFHHQTPRPEDHEFPYPDFLWLVYMSEAGAEGTRRVLDDYEEEVVFRRAARARRLELSEDSRTFLDAALSLRSRTTTRG